MCKFPIALAVLLASFGLVRADEFIGVITKVEGNKVTLMKLCNGYFGMKEPPPPEKLTITAADSPKVNWGIPSGPRFDAYDAGDPVEGGLTNKQFREASVMARITTENDKVAVVLIMGVYPEKMISAWLNKKIDGMNAVTPANFYGTITKVDGNKIYMKKFYLKGEKNPPPAEDVVMTAADNCKVIGAAFFDPKSGETQGGEPVEGGMTNKLFKKAIVSAAIVTDGDKVIEMRLMMVQPDNEFFASVAKVDGQKVTFTRGGVLAIQYDEKTLSAVANVKVVEMKMDPAKGPQVVTIAGGLKNQIFEKKVNAVLVLDDENRIAEVRVMPAFKLPPEDK